MFCHNLWCVSDFEILDRYIDVRDITTIRAVITIAIVSVITCHKIYSEPLPHSDSAGDHWNDRNGCPKGGRRSAPLKTQNYGHSLRSFSTQSLWVQLVLKPFFKTGSQIKLFAAIQMVIAIAKTNNKLANNKQIALHNECHWRGHEKPIPNSEVSNGLKNINQKMLNKIDFLWSCDIREQSMAYMNTWVKTYESYLAFHRRNAFKKFVYKSIKTFSLPIETTSQKRLIVGTHSCLTRR